MKPLAIYRIRKGVPGVGRKLANHFGAQEVTSKKPAPKIPDGAVVVNYGRSVVPDWFDDAVARGVRVLNHPDSVALAVDKRKTLARLKEAGVACLDATESQAVAKQWAAENPVIIRATAKGKKGNGVSIAHSPAEVKKAPLYTAFYDKTHEFRVHVFNGEVIDYVQKKKMGEEKQAAFGLNGVNDLVRNHKRGWVFAHNKIIIRDQIKQLALDAANALGLDFCGVDILAKFKKPANGNKMIFVDAVVCEVNSAPGMSATATLQAYTGAIAAYASEPNFVQPPADVE